MKALTLALLSAISIPAMADPLIVIDPPHRPHHREYYHRRDFYRERDWEYYHRHHQYRHHDPCYHGRVIDLE
jgi:hypothetical protein